MIDDPLSVDEAAPSNTKKAAPSNSKKAALSNSKLEKLAVSALLLDPRNPRLPEELHDATQGELLRWLNDHEVLDELARSMLENGFFEHEPLIVLPPGEQERRIVVEGNRRLAALTILLQLDAAKEADIKFDFAVPPTEGQLDRLRRISCFAVSGVEEVRKFLGFRHIGGLKTWSPEAKARYLEVEVDRAIEAGSSTPFRDIARQVGSTAPAVRGQYLALSVLRAAQEVRIDSRYVLRERFGVWNRLLNSPDVRSFIGLGETTTVENIQTALDGLKKTGLKQVIGDLTPPSSGGKSVLWDSRDVTVYGKVLANERALASLRRYDDLSIARQIVDRGEIGDRLRAITRTIETITQDLESYDIDAIVEAAAKGLLGASRTLSAAITVRVEDNL